jgi:NAD+ synthase (glutamine-hydrolysing)
VLKAGFVSDNLEALDKVAAHTGHCAAVVGYVAADRDIYNAAALCANGTVMGTYRKRLLPNYAVFDEARYFTPGDASDPYELYVIGGVKVGISICEDVWSPTGPLAEQAAGGAELNININGSPYHFDKASGRERMLATRAADASCALVYVNQVCGQDELVFDGGSMVFDADGTLVARAAQFVEELMITDVHIEPVYRKRLLDPRGRRTEVEMPLIHVSEASYGRDTAPSPVRVEQGIEQSTEQRIAPRLEPMAELYEALVLGTCDNERKNC